jgi:hypothetical protein
MEILTRAAAKAAGAKFYYTGKPCKRAGHLSSRYTSNGHCVDCRQTPKHREEAAAYRAENRDDLLAYKAKYDAEHREERVAYHARYRAEHSEEKVVYNAEWVRKNRGKHNAKCAKRRAQEKSQRCAQTCCTDEQINAPWIFAASYLFRGKRLQLEVDHKTALNLGGLHCAKNLQLLSEVQHKAKNKSDMKLMAQIRRAGKKWSAAFDPSTYEVIEEEMMPMLKAA